MEYGHTVSRPFAVSAPAIPAAVFFDFQDCDSDAQIGVQKERPNFIELTKYVLGYAFPWAFTRF